MIKNKLASKISKVKIVNSKNQTLVLFDNYRFDINIDNSLDCITCFGIIYHGNSGQICAIITRIHDNNDNKLMLSKNSGLNINYGFQINNLGYLSINSISNFGGTL